MVCLYISCRSPKIYDWYVCGTVATSCLVRFSSFPFISFYLYFRPFPFSSIRLHSLPSILIHSPGYPKYMSLAQLVEGEESVKYFTKGIELMEKRKGKLIKGDDEEEEEVEGAMALPSTSPMAKLEELQSDISRGWTVDKYMWRRVRAHANTNRHLHEQTDRHEHARARSQPKTNKTPNKQTDKQTNRCPRVFHRTLHLKLPPSRSHFGG